MLLWLWCRPVDTAPIQPLAELMPQLWPQKDKKKKRQPFMLVEVEGAKEKNKCLEDYLCFPDMVLKLHFYKFFVCVALK